MDSVFATGANPIGAKKQYPASVFTPDYRILSLFLPQC
jgi:hypothetical protein